MLPSSSHRIRYICLSDLHLGEEDSVLTALLPDRYECDHERPSPTLVLLVSCLRELLSHQPADDKPTLILNGDALELAFASYGQSLATFEHFMRLVVRPAEELFDRVVYVPGNHDHHVWEIARETQFVKEVMRYHRGGDLPAARHTTASNIGAAVPAYLMGQLMRRVRGLSPEEDLDFPVRVLYPNLALFDEADDRCVLIHHGHYLESLYMFMSWLRQRLFPGDAIPSTVDHLEADNFAWIDFVWSLLGRSGDAGARAEILYKTLQYPMNMQAFVEDLADRIAATTDIPFVPGEWLERRVLRTVFEYAAQKLTGDRCRDDCVTGEIERGLSTYVFRHGYRQLADEYGHVPREMTFVFGHTHKPYTASVQDGSGRSVGVYNTGGWVVDSAKRSPNHGGGIALISDRLHTVMLRLYDDGSELPCLRTEQVEDASPEARAFRGEVERRIRGGADPSAEPTATWRRCAAVVVVEADHRRAEMRRKYLEER